MKKINKRWLAIVVALTLAVSSVAVGLSLTYAASPVQERFKQPNAYTNVVEKGRSETRSAGSVSAVRGSDTAIADVTFISGTSYTVSGKKAGTMGAAVATKSITLNPAWQVTDSSLISGYDLANNGGINKKSGDANFNVNDFVTTYTTAWNATVDGAVGNSNYVTNAAAKSQIVWTSRNTDIATVTATGTVSVVGKGAALLLGEFTDRWGVPHTMAMLVGVDTVVGKSLLSDLLDAIKKGQTVLGLDPNPYEAAGLGALQAAVNAANTVLNSADPNDTQINGAIAAINSAIDGLEPANTGGGDGQITVPDGSGGEKTIRPAPGPENVWEVLTPEGNSKVPPEFIYDPDGSLKGAPPALNGDEVPAYKDGYVYYAEETPAGSNIFVPIDENGDRDYDNAKWGGANKKPGGDDDRPAMKSGSTWYAEDPMGTNLWKPVKTAAGSGQGTLLATDWIGGGANGKPSGTDNLYPVIYHDGYYYAGPFAKGDDQYYVGMGNNGRFDTSGYNSTGRPQGDNVHPSDEKLYWNGTGTPGDGGTGGFEPNKPGAGVTAPTSISNASLPNATQGAPYNATLVSDGTAPITWTINSGALPAGLTLNSDGTITGTPTGTGTSNFVVKATNAAGNVTKSLSITVGTEVVPPVEGGDQPTHGRKLTALQAGDTSEWIEIATNGGYSLILRVKGINPVLTKFHGSSPAYDSSAVRENVNSWYYYDVSGSAPIRSKAVQNDVMQKVGTNAAFGDRSNAAGRSTPKSTKPAQTEAALKDIAFLLSFQEAALYCSDVWWSKATGGNQPSTYFAKENWKSLGIAKDLYWWLRSPGHYTGGVSYVGAAGYVYGDYYTVTAAMNVRPAIWVESSIFNQ